SVSTLVSPSKIVNSTAGYLVPGRTWWYGEYEISQPNSAGSAAFPYSSFQVSPRPNCSYRTMSSSGAEHTAAALSSGRCVTDAPTSSPPFDPPHTASWPAVVQPSAMSFSAAA